MCLWNQQQEQELKAVYNDLSLLLIRLKRFAEEAKCWRMEALASDLDRLVEELAIQIFVPAPDVDPAPEELPEELDDGGL